MTRKTLGIRAPSGEGERDAPRAWAASGVRAERLKERARAARGNPDAAQLALAEALSGPRVGGIRFRQQFIVGTAIVDFACPSRWLVIQITRADDNAEVNALQDAKLADGGIRVARFTEAEVLEDMDGVIKAVNALLNTPYKPEGQR